MLESGSSSSWAVFLLGVALLLSTSVTQGAPTFNRIAAPGQALYYQRVDAGSQVAPNESLKRTNRSLLKWWDELFPQNNNNCCNNNNAQYPPAPALPYPAVNNNCNNGLKLQDLDPFKQMKLFKKLPDLFPSASPCGFQCGGGCGQQQTNYAAPVSPSYQSADGYGTVTDGGYAKPNPEYNGPGDGDAGYLPPAPAPAYEAPAPPPASYDLPAEPAPAYDPPAPPAATYEPVPPSTSYEPAPPSSYAQSEPASDGYGQPVQPTYVAAQPPQIVYQPIIYLSASPAPQPAAQAKTEAYSYASQAPAPAPAYEPLPPTPSCYQPPAPAAPASPSYYTPPCQTPIRLSLIDQPYRVAPELFQEYNYRLAQNLL